MEEDYRVERDAIRDSLRSKMYAPVDNDGERNPIISITLPPEYGLEPQEKQTEITPGYPLNKTHRSSILLGGNVPDEVLKKRFDCSYESVF
ncbi:MAG: MmcQ/YjbR family DNA-binding protein [Tannerella sp.]|nr:MmcQ/YjbR family DNA-binding protein [Tannerella sp.]